MEGGGGGHVGRMFLNHGPEERSLLQHSLAARKRKGRNGFMWQETRESAVVGSVSA